MRRLPFPRRAVATAVVSLAVLGACGSSGTTTGSSPSTGSTTSAASGTSIGAGLSGPSGLRAAAVATGMKDASALAYDSASRLWVATADYSDSGADAVYVVDAPGATPVKVVTDVHTPLGLLWIGSTLYVSETGGVLALSGFDGTAFAHRTTALPLPTDVGEVNGMALAPDGRIWLGISAPCDHCTPTSPYSASVVSFAPDGSGLRVEAAGIRAPVGLTYYPGTSDLFVTMNQRDDLGDATPGDWLSVVASGQHWGFPDCYGQGGSACAGAPSPAATLDPHAAVSGVTVLPNGIGSTAGPVAIVAEWATGKVLAVALTKTATGYTGTASTWISGINKPVPVITGPSGQVVIGDWDTGTIYALTAT